MSFLADCFSLKCNFGQGSPLPNCPLIISRTVIIQIEDGNKNGNLSVKCLEKYSLGSAIIMEHSVICPAMVEYYVDGKSIQWVSFTKHE